MCRFPALHSPPRNHSVFDADQCADLQKCYLRIGGAGAAPCYFAGPLSEWDVALGGASLNASFQFLPCPTLRNIVTARLPRQRYHRCMTERELRQFAIIVLLGVIAYAVVVGGAMLLWPGQ